MKRDRCGKKRGEKNDQRYRPAPIGEGRGTLSTIQTENAKKKKEDVINAGSRNSYPVAWQPLEAARGSPSPSAPPGGAARVAGR